MCQIGLIWDKGILSSSTNLALKSAPLRFPTIYESVLSTTTTGSLLLNCTMFICNNSRGCCPGDALVILFSYWQVIKYKNRKLFVFVLDQERKNGPYTSLCPSVWRNRLSSTHFLSLNPYLTPSWWWLHSWDWFSTYAYFNFMFSPVCVCVWHVLLVEVHLFIRPLISLWGNGHHISGWGQLHVWLDILNVACDACFLMVLPDELL